MKPRNIMLLVLSVLAAIFSFAFAGCKNQVSSNPPTESASASPKIIWKSTELGTSNRPSQQPRFNVVVSPDGRRYASTDNGTENDDPKVVIIDGVAGKEFSKVSAVIFSPDSKRVAYFGITKDGQTMLVVQGHGKTETAVKGEVSMLTFSPDSKNLAYVVTSEEGARVVMDGNKLPSRQPLTKIEHLAFTPGTNIPIYVYYQNDKDLPCGVKYLFDMPSNGTPVVTSADGRRLINVHSKEGVFTLQDVKVGKNPDGSFSINAGPAGERECDSVHSVIISPDDNRLAYAVTDGGKSLAVLDGEDGKAYDDIAKGSLAFSPDSKHFAYLAKSGEDWFIVIDGAEGKKYNQSAPRSAVFFSPDSQHTAFALKNVIVVDKTEYKTKYPLGTYTLIFSPDSKRTAYMEVSPYIGELGVFNYSINIDGDESPEYTGLGWAGKTSEIYQPVFSPDSKHVAYCTLKRDEEGKANKLFVVDTTEVETGMEPWCAPVFDSPTKFHYVGTKDDKVFLVEVEITE